MTDHASTLKRLSTGSTALDAILGGGFKVLNEGDQVTFDIVASDKGPKAQNVQRQAAQ